MEALTSNEWRLMATQAGKWSRQTSPPSSLPLRPIAVPVDDRRGPTAYVMSDDAVEPGSEGFGRPDDESGGSSREAGFIRALTRTTAIVYRTIVFGSLPRRVPVRHVGVVTDGLATVLDTMAQLRDAKRQVEVHHYSAHPPRLTWSSLWAKGRFLGHTVMTALPPLVQSMVLGTAVFGIYEEVKDLFDAIYGLDQEADVLDGEAVAPVVLAKTFSSSITAGGLAGASHGVLYTGWEHAAGVIRGVKTPTPLLFGTTLAHATSHATLFGSYEAVKHALFMLSGSDHTSVQGVACVSVAGAVAGVCEESVSYYTVRWEEEGVQSLRRSWTLLGPPPIRVLRSSLLPGALGFLAFEYGREFVMRKDVGDDDWGDWD